MKRPFLLFKRGEYWYFRLADDKTFHTTGQKSRSKAEAFVVEFLKNAEIHRKHHHVSFRLYAEPFFIWDRCPYFRAGDLGEPLACKWLVQDMLFELLALDSGMPSGDALAFLAQPSDVWGPYLPRERNLDLFLLINTMVELKR